MATALSLVTYNIFPPKLGGQKCIASFNEYFSKQHQLFCFTIKDNDPACASYKVFNQLSNHRFRYINIFYFGMIRKIIHQKNISHIILEHPYYGWMALLLKYFCNVKLIIHSHNIEAERFKSVGKWWWKLLWHYEKWVHSKADFTFSITEEDQNYFMNQYKLDPHKLTVITYGFPFQNIPPAIEKSQARNQLLKKYSLQEDILLFLFNGALDYEPNLNAVKNIVEKINPLFLRKNIGYKIIICGKNLPAEMNELKEYADKNIIYAGFVDDITLYFKGVDAFLNPVEGGGGIKTKLVEALGYNLNAVSSINGAVGVDKNICNGKLFLCPNKDWQCFADNMQNASVYNSSIPPEFFTHFYWGNIAKKAGDIVSAL